MSTRVSVRSRPSEGRYRGEMRSERSDDQAQPRHFGRSERRADRSDDAHGANAKEALYAGRLGRHSRLAGEKGGSDRRFQAAAIDGPRVNTLLGDCGVN